MLGRLCWIDSKRLRTFILACQDEETGGFADRPGDVVGAVDCIRSKTTIQYKNCFPYLYIYSYLSKPCLQVDLFHTLFGLAGLSLLGETQLKPVNPVLCLPEETIQRLGLHLQLLN